MARMRKISITWVTTSGRLCRKTVSEDGVTVWVDKIRVLPDVKTDTVRVAMAEGKGGQTTK